MNEIKYKWAKNLDDPSYKDGLDIRFKVFVEEQKVPKEEEIDEHEEESYHLTIYQDGKAVGTGRILPKGAIAKFGRIAVLKEVRGTGLGKLLMDEMERKSKELDFQKIQLGGQVSAIAFYNKCGFREYGEVFVEAGIDHKMMEKKI